MDRHPGGEAHTRYMAELSFLPSGSKWLDMGAGEGSAMKILETLGYFCRGIDLEPRGKSVEKGNFLQTSYPDAGFDGVLSQCAFYVSGDVPGAFREAARVLRKGGKLLYSDVCYDAVGLLNTARQAGFAVRHMEDLTDQWREYYLEALWREECVPKGKGCSYLLLVCERM